MRSKCLGSKKCKEYFSGEDIYELLYLLTYLFFSFLYFVCKLKMFRKFPCKKSTCEGCSFCMVRKYIYVFHQLYNIKSPLSCIFRATFTGQGNKRNKPKLD